MPETDSDLYAMTYEDADAAFDDADAAVLPTGSIEQHSVHLPLSVDSVRADHLSAELVDAAPDHDLDLVRLPTLPFGRSEHHMHFPGTLTLSDETYTDAVVDIGASLGEHGVDRLLVVNCHGGNRQPLALAADRLTRDHGVTTHFVHWTDFARDRLEDEFGEGWGHAGDHETSVMELYRPDLVKEEKKQPQNARDWPESRSFGYFEEFSELGGLGDPTNSDPEAVEEIIEAATADILDAVADDIENGW